MAFQVRVAEKVLPQAALVAVLRMVRVTVPPRSVATGASKVQAAPHSTVLLVAQVIVGGVVSVIVTVWLHWALLPQASVAFQVRVALKVLPQPAFVIVLTTEIVFVPQVSVAVGASKVQAVPSSTDLLVAQVIAGAVVSTTLTVWLHWALLPHGSVMRQTHVATKALPQVALVVVLNTVIVLVPLKSVAVGASKVHAAPHSTVLFVGHRAVGLVVSTTLTVWLQVEALPLPSVARQVRVAVKVRPQVALVTVPASVIVGVPQLSVAVGSSKVQGWPVSTTLLVGQRMTGGWVSRMVTVNVQED